MFHDYCQLLLMFVYEKILRKLSVCVCHANRIEGKITTHKMF